MHPYLSHLMAEQHMADLRRDADEYRLAHAVRDHASSGDSHCPDGRLSWWSARALLRRFATA